MTDDLRALVRFVLLGALLGASIETALTWGETTDETDARRGSADPGARI